MIEVLRSAAFKRLASWRVWTHTSLALTAVFGSALMFASAPPPTASADWDVETASFLVLLNEYRAQNGAGPLAVDAKLQAAADWMSIDQLITAKCTEKNPFTCGHTDTLGRNPTARATQQFGWPLSNPVAENLNWGGDTAKQALESWKTSPGHNANMLNKNWVATGIGRVCSGRSCMWTQKFTSLMTEPYGPAAVVAAPVNFNGTWTAQFPNGRTAAGPIIDKGPITLTQQGDQVTGTMAISLVTYKPLTGADVVTIQGKAVAGTPKLIGKFSQPASAGFGAVSGDIELTLAPNGTITAFWTNGTQFWNMTESPRAEAVAPPAPQPTATPVPTPVNPPVNPVEPVDPVNPPDPINPPDMPVDPEMDPEMDMGGEQE